LKQIDWRKNRLEIEYLYNITIQSLDDFLNAESKLNVWPYFNNFQKQCGVYKEKDFSFVVIENNKIIGLCPLYLTIIDNRAEFSDDGGYLRSPIVSLTLSIRKREKVFDFIFKTIDDIAKENNVQKVMFLMDPQLNLTKANPFLKYYYINTSINTQVIDLRADISDLRQGFRKSYKALVNKGLKTYQFRVMNYLNPDYEIHELYRKIHKKAAGRETRNKESFDKQFDQLKNNEATLISVICNGQYVQMNYFNHYHDFVYYASAADDPDFSDSCLVPIGHSIMWFAMEYFKNENYKFFEIGYQYSESTLFDNISEKEINISYFKRGFGGESVSLYRGIKYLNLSLMKSELSLIKEKV